MRPTLIGGGITGEPRATLQELFERLVTRHLNTELVPDGHARKVAAEVEKAIKADANN